MNFDYGSDKLKLAPRSTWVGFGGAARFQVSNRFAMAPRLEVFDDRQGFATGASQKVKEFTLTGEMKIREGYARMHLINMELTQNQWSEYFGIGFFNSGLLRNNLTFLFRENIQRQAQICPLFF